MPFEENRVWIINRHPNLNIFGIGHDSGMLIFKIHKERITSKLLDNNTLISSYRDLLNINLLLNKTQQNIELEFDICKLGYSNSKIDSIIVNNKLYVLVCHNN